MVTRLDDRSSREGRPSSDALVQAAQQETHGRLKIFVGAAPGVGKTYEMLTASRARRSRFSRTPWQIAMILGCRHARLSGWSRTSPFGDSARLRAYDKAIIIYRKATGRQSRDTRAFRLEALRQPCKDGAAKPKLRSTNPDATTIANLIDGIADIQHVEPQLHGGLDFLHHGHVHHFIGRQ